MIIQILAPTFSYVYIPIQTLIIPSWLIEDDHLTAGAWAACGLTSSST